MPVKFDIYRDGKRLTNFQPTALYAVGPESVPISADLAVHDGTISVSRSDDMPLGVALLWEAGPAGCYHMETTRLPSRPKPYILSVELARFRLMKIVQKLEDWNLFDFPKTDHVMSRLREAQDVFSDALTRTDDPVAASSLGDQVLARAVALSEELALFHADLFIGRRRAANGFVRHIFGCRVDPSVQNQRYRDSIAGNFDYAVLPIPWKVFQPQEGAFDTTLIDGWAEMLTKKRLPIIAGPMISLEETELPDWMFIWENDFETMRELAYEHVHRLVQRYRKTVSLWNVVGNLCSNRCFTLTFEQMIELTRLLISQVKNVHPNARTVVTISHPFGEYHAKNPSSVHPFLYAEMVAQAGISFDGFAVEIELGVPQPGMFLRDLFQISSMLDRFSNLGRPLFITAVSAPDRANPDPSDRSEGRNNPAAAGQWRRPWDPQLQADWMEAVYNIALSKPFVESVAWGNLADINHTVPGGGLLDDMFQPKPSFERIQHIRNVIAQWQGRR